MDILEEAQETLFFPSCGKQYDGSKETRPIWSLPRAGRETEKKLFISHKHNQDALGKDSPGHCYEPRRIKELPKWGFGTAPARPAPKQRYPEESNNLLSKHVNEVALNYKYHNKKALIGVCPRNAESNAPDMHGFVPGKLSPGPQRYNPQHCPPQRLLHAPGVDQNAPKYSMRVKTPAKDLIQSTGPKVGPGLYPTPAACEEQASSEKPSLPQWKINKVDRFPDKKKRDNYRLWDGEGQKKIEFSRSFSATPSFSFGTSTRGHAKKISPALTDLDRGPVAKMAKPHKSHPNLPTRKEILKYSDVNGA